MIFLANKSGFCFFKQKLVVVCHLYRSTPPCRYLLKAVLVAVGFSGIPGACPPNSGGLFNVMHHPKGKIEHDGFLVNQG